MSQFLGLQCIYGILKNVLNEPVELILIPKRLRLMGQKEGFAVKYPLPVFPTSLYQASFHTCQDPQESNIILRLLYVLFTGNIHRIHSSNL